MLIPLTFLCLFISCFGSGITEGDLDPWMQECIEGCLITQKCDRPKNDFEQTAPFYLHLTQWDCSSDCAYVCMRQHSDRRKEEGKEMLKYGGKWPFRRIGGFQEIASSLFSLGNLVPYVLGGYMYYKLVPGTYHLKNLFLLYAVIGSLTWIFSFVFHCRDTKTTELFDYVFASCTFFSGSAIATIRIFQIQSSSVILLIIVAFILWGFQHWNYMLNVEFDYTYNVVIGIINGIYQTIMWIGWYFLVGRKDSDRAYAFKVTWGYACLWLAATMEVFDFSPFFLLVDPHSLWHLGTIPLAILLWNFYRLDALYEDARIQKEKYHLG